MLLNFATNGMIRELFALFILAFFSLLVGRNGSKKRKREKVPFFPFLSDEWIDWQRNCRRKKLEKRPKYTIRFKYYAMNRFQILTFTLEYCEKENVIKM